MTATLFDSPAETFEARLDALHEMLYRRGGIRPVNAAIEELAKLVLLQLKHSLNPEWMPDGQNQIASVLDPGEIRDRDTTEAAKHAFAEAIRLPEFVAALPGGGTQPLWPLDEPLRIDRPDVLAAALELIGVDLLRSIEEREDFDILGTAFDVLLRGRYDHSGGLATYLTPHGVAAMLAELCMGDLEVPPWWRAGQAFAGDPCCGTGRFLVAMIREARRLAALDDSSSATRFAEALGGSGLVGADQSPSSVAKARLNLLLYGLERPRVFTVADSITDGHLDTLRGTMGLILTNPPFGDGKYDDDSGVARTRALMPSTNGRRTIDPALAFVARCLDLLGDGGRLGIVLPDGLIDGGVLRAALLTGDVSTRLRNVSIEANVSLPTATFALSGTVARTSTLVLRKGGAVRTQILLAKADHVGFLKQAGAATPDPDGDDLPTIASTGVQAWLGAAEPVLSVDGLAVLGQAPDISLVDREGIGTVDPSRVDPSALAARKELVESGGVRLGSYLQAQPSKSRRADGVRPFVSILHVDELGVVSWHEALEHAPTTPGRVARPGDVLVSQLNPRKLRATAIPPEMGECLCSSEFGVFAPTADPYAVLIVLNDRRVRAQLSPLGRGTSSSRRRIDDADVLGLVVPPITAEITRRADALRTAHAANRSATLEAAAALGTLSGEIRE